MNFDQITFIIWVFFLPIWLVWELVVLGLGERTISNIAKRRGWQFSSGVFFWSAMPFHWWCPSPVEQYAVGTAAFWLIVFCLFLYNVRTWRLHSRDLVYWTEADRWFNWPVWYLVSGPVAAVLLFPQAQATPWRPVWALLT